MANEIWHNFETGNNLYTRIRRRSDSKIYNVVTGGDTFDTWADADVGDYDLALTDEDGNFYAVDFPSGISAGVYDVGIFLRAGASPATDDIELAQGVIYWDGSAEFNPYIIGKEQRKDLIVEDDTEGVKTKKITSTGRLVTEGQDC